MTRHSLIAFAMMTLPVAAAEHRVTQSELPQAVRDMLPGQTAGAEIRGITKESAKGKTVYEVETVKSGMTRDFLVSATGTVLESEEQVALDSIPAASRKVLEGKARGAKIEKVEALTKNGTVSYEATVNRNGKKSEITAR